RSLFFLAKLQEWGLQEGASAIEQLDGSSVEWNLQELNISEKAWNRVIHRGIPPVWVFAHPTVLRSIPRSTGYYRMLAMVSQKSMKRVNLDTESYETTTNVPSVDISQAITQHLNKIISRLVEQEINIDPRKLDLWRGMAAGAQAQGSWQNAKGVQYEVIVQQILASYVQESGIIARQSSQRLDLQNGRSILFGSDPDVRLLQGQQLLSAVEIKGGIDVAGAHERLGAAIKTLRDCKAKYPDCVTILLLRRETLTSGLIARLQQSETEIERWFALEDILNDAKVRSDFVRMFLWER
ncbi:MAG: XcyI family restriction endonuclease, partial [Fimbriimonadales bacterium]